jgi:hypothetical protein
VERLVAEEKEVRGKKVAATKSALPKKKTSAKAKAKSPAKKKLL